MKKPYFAALALLAACDVGAGGSNPESAFNGMRKSFESKNWGGAFDNVDPEDSEKFTLGMMFAASFTLMENQSAKGELDAIMKKHGIDEKLGESSLKKIKDHRALFIDLMNFMEKNSKPGKAAYLDVVGDIKEVKIDGETAKGTFTHKDGKTSPMNFVRRNGRRYVSLD
jgi:hypothetical protein